MGLWDGLDYHSPYFTLPSVVLSKALEVWGLTTTPLTSPDVPEVAQAPEKETAFICNLQADLCRVSIVGDLSGIFHDDLQGVGLSSGQAGLKE
eukprot:175285-Pelagomonas_calceolata.AAC.1